MTIAPVFTQDWAAWGSYWPDMFADYGWGGQEDLRFLEIGCFEGRTTTWLLDNVLTDPSSSITVIDTFEGSPEFEQMGIDMGFEQRFRLNVAPYGVRVEVHKGRSQEILPTLQDEFDFIYVDGSHTADDVWADANLSWPLLKQTGLMVFDDYGWESADGSTRLPAEETPRPGVDQFLRDRAGEYVLRMSAYQLVIEKL